MSQIKGLIIQSRLSYIENYLDNTDLRAINEKLSPSVNQILLEQVFRVNKYPFSLLKELDDALSRVVSESPQQLFSRVGADFAEVLLDRYFFNYVEAKKPQKLLAQLGRLYDKLWGFGHYEFRAEKDHEAEIQISYDEEVHEAYVWFMEAFLTASVEICTGKKAVLNKVKSEGQNAYNYVCHIGWG